MALIQLQSEHSDWWRWLSVAIRMAREGGSTETHHAGAPEGVVMLASSMHREEFGGWTFIGANPVAVAKGSRTDVEILTLLGERLTDRCRDPFTAVEKLMLLAPKLPHLAGCPFTFPVVGAFGYGCGEPTQTLNIPEGQENGYDVWWGLYDTFVALHPTQGGYLVTHDFDVRSQECGDGLETQRAWLQAYDGVSGVDLPADRQLPGIQPVWSPERYSEAYTIIVDGLLSGEFYQACLTHPLEGDGAEVSAVGLYRWLASNRPAPYSALIIPDECSAAIVSASPERFLRFEDGRVTARPMKGTLAVVAGKEDEGRQLLRDSEKDRAENVMIVDLMRHDLGRVCKTGSVRVPELFHVETFGKVHQMTSTVTGELRDDLSLAQAVKAAFPPGSMTGAPKVQAMQTLAAVEEGNRGWYSGALGWLDGKSGELSVVIRSALVEKNRVRWHVGGGIVMDSTCEAEWQESLEKAPTKDGQWRKERHQQ